MNRFLTTLLCVAVTMTAALADEYAEVDGIPYTLSSRSSDTHRGHSKLQS